MYNHTLPSVVDPFGTPVKPTIFTRYVTIEYLPNVPPLPYPDDSIKDPGVWGTMDPLLDQPKYNRMRVTSVVGWSVGGANFSVSLQTILTDHLGRENLTD